MSQTADSSNLETSDKLTTEYLASHGISYEPNPETTLDLPEHVAYLKSALLDFDCTISQRLDLRDGILDIRHFQLDDAFRRLHSNDTEQVAIRDSVERYKKVQESTHALIQANESEYKWQKLYEGHFFERLEASVKPCDTDTRRVAREKFYYKSFESASTRHWSLFRGSRPTSQGEAKLSEPRVDYTAFFKVFNIDNDRPTESSSRQTMVPYGRWPWKNSPRKGLVRSFSTVVLDHLSLYGLEPCAANSRRRNAKPKSKGDKTHYMCFPWLVVEHKAVNQDVKVCYCQAVNGAHAALTMLRNLAKHANQGVPGLAHIPPVTTITTIGPKVKVWVAYATDLEGSCKMTSIWTGSITRPSDIIKLEAILENLHTYAINELRPWISSYIEQWLELFPMGGSPPSAIDEKPFAQLRSAQNGQPEAEKAADPQTPQSNPPPSAEFQSASKSDILHMLQAEHRQLLGDVANLLRETQSTPGRDTPSQAPFASPSPSAGPRPSSSEGNKPPQPPLGRDSDSSRPPGYAFQHSAPSTPTPVSARSMPGQKTRRQAVPVLTPSTEVANTPSDHHHHNFDSISFTFRLPPTPNPDNIDSKGKGIEGGQVGAQRSGGKNPGALSLWSDASTSAFGSDAPAFGGSNGPVSSFGSKASTSTGLFGSSPSKGLVDSATSTFGVDPNASGPHSGSGPSAKSVDGNDALEPDDTEESEYVSGSEHAEESEYVSGSEHAEESEYVPGSEYAEESEYAEDTDGDPIGLVPSSPPGKTNGKSSRRVKSHDGIFSAAKEDAESFPGSHWADAWRDSKWTNLSQGNQVTARKPKGTKRRTDR